MGCVRPELLTSFCPSPLNTISIAPVFFHIDLKASFKTCAKNEETSVLQHCVGARPVVCLLVCLFLSVCVALFVCLSADLFVDCFCLLLVWGALAVYQGSTGAIKQQQKTSKGNYSE